eukprot:gene26262-17364_t
MCVIGGSSGESACPFAISCSLQLPFAFTPSAQSLSSLNQHLLGGSGAGRCLPPYGTRPTFGPDTSSGVREATADASYGSSSNTSSPHHIRPYPDGSVSGGESVGVCGRDISALATIRRPSWSLSYSSSLDRAAPWMLPHFGGISPVQDSVDGPLSMSMMSSLASPHQQQRQFVVPLGANLAMVPYGGSISPMHPTLLPTATSAGISAIGRQADIDSTIFEGLEDGAVPPGMEALEDETLVESKSDLLPFALEEDPMNETPSQSYSAGKSVHTGIPVGHGDVAVGAFIRMLQEAPPLDHASFGLHALAASSVQSGAFMGSSSHPRSSLPPVPTELNTALLQLQHSAQCLKSFLSASQ